MIIIISDGQRKGIIHAKDDSYDLDYDIIEPLIQNQFLGKKNKMFVVEASRGPKESNDSNYEFDGAASGPSPRNIFKLFSNFEGYKSYKDGNGSFLIQCF